MERLSSIRSRLSQLLIVMGLVASIGAPALADERVIVTYTGTVSNLYDPNNLFLGSGFTDRFVFDVNNKYRTQLLPNLDEIIGGPQFGVSSPALSSELTIAGRTVVFP